MTNIIFGIVIGLTIFSYVFTPKGDIETAWYKLNADSTDDIINDKKSGLTLYTDHGTGCQYLQAGPFGGMTPRLNKEGTHICEILYVREKP